MRWSKVYVLMHIFCNNSFFSFSEKKPLILVSLLHISREGCSFGKASNHEYTTHFEMHTKTRSHAPLQPCTHA